MIKVIKFGGTIINNELYINNVIRIIDHVLSNNEKLVIIVSAIGRDNEPYSTSKLGKLGKNLDSVHKAELLSYGERISSLVFLNTLLEKKYNANIIKIENLGINLQGDYLQGDLLFLDNKYLINEINNHDIIIVPGFIGINNNNIGLLGTGGSDLTAIYIAKMLNINEITLYKDVAGVMSGDPKVIKNCNTISQLSYDEALTFSKCGAKVVQDLAILEAKNSKIIIKINSIYDLKEKSIISDKDSGRIFKGVISKNEYIYLIYDTNYITYETICSILKKNNFECEEVKKYDNYVKIKLIEVNINSTMNILHHYFIGKNI